MTNISLKIHKSTDHNNVLLPSNYERNVFKIKIGIIAILELDSIFFLSLTLSQEEFIQTIMSQNKTRKLFHKWVD